MDGTRFLSIMTPCKGRIHHLKATLSSYARLDPKHVEVIVVDYGDPDHCAKWVNKRYPHITTLTVMDNVEYFNLSRARNCGALVAQGRWFMFMDADMGLDKQTFRALYRLAQEEAPAILIPDWERQSKTPTVVRNSVFHAVRGFDESLEGWGWEDIDFFSRAVEYGSVVKYSSKLFSVIQHGVEERVNNYKEKTLDARNSPVTNIRNMKRALSRTGPVNPHGYGVGRFELCAGAKYSKKELTPDEEFYV